MRGYLAGLWRAVARQSLGMIALVVVLSTGTAYAASVMWTGQNIVDGSLTTSDVQDGSLTGADIADGSVSSSDLASGGGGGGDVLLQADPAAFSFDASEWTTPPTVQTVWGGALTMPEAGFAHVDFVADISAGPEVCGSEGAGARLQVYVDGEQVRSAMAYYDYDPSGGLQPFGWTNDSVYLGAGDHTVTLGAYTVWCPNPQGQFHVSSAHLLLTPAS